MISLVSYLSIHRERRKSMVGLVNLFVFSWQKGWVNLWRIHIWLFEFGLLINPRNWNGLQVVFLKSLNDLWNAKPYRWHQSQFLYYSIISSDLIPSLNLWYFYPDGLLNLQSNSVLSTFLFSSNWLLYWSGSSLFTFMLLIALFLKYRSLFFWTSNSVILLYLTLS